MNVLVFAPHNDDEVLGVGGTISKMSNQGHDVYVCEVTMGKNYIILQGEAKEAHKVLGVKETIFLNLPVTQLKTMDQSTLNSSINEVVQRLKPEVVFVPHRGDMHNDHSEVAAAVMVAVRPISAPFIKKVLAYETLSETEWNTPTVDNAFIPNVWNDITEYIEIKEKAMMCYKSQLQEFPRPRSIQAIRALSALRGSTICVNNAEAFMMIREIEI